MLHWHWFLPVSEGADLPARGGGPAVHAHAPDWTLTTWDDGPRIAPDTSAHELVRPAPSSLSPACLSAEGLGFAAVHRLETPTPQASTTLRRNFGRRAASALVLLSHLSFLSSRRRACLARAAFSSTGVAQIRSCSGGFLPAKRRGAFSMSVTLAQRATVRRATPWAVLGLGLALIAANIMHDTLFHDRATNEVTAAKSDAAPPSPSLATTVVLPLGKFREAKIATATARLESLPTEIGVAGKIEANTDRRVEVRPRTAGIVRRVHVALGQTVKKGRPARHA